MARLPRINYRQTIRKLRKAGFVFDRQGKGSHEFWKNPKTKRVVMVPRHPGTIPLGTLSEIVKQSGLTLEEFSSL